MNENIRLLLIHSQTILFSEKVLSVDHGIGTGSFKIFSRWLGTPIFPRSLPDWHHVDLAFNLFMRFLVQVTLHSTSLAGAWLTGCLSPCCHFIVLMGVCPLSSSFLKALLTRETSLLMSPGSFLAHFWLSILCILIILLAKSAMTFTAVSTATSTASSIVICEVGCSKLILFRTLANRPLLMLSSGESRQVICAVPIRLTVSPLKILHGATLGTISGS